jgi:hypothetical protein
MVTMNYINRALNYYEGDRVESWDQPCARRPSPAHVFTGIVSLDPAVMWREKTAPELDAEKDAEATQGLDQLVALRAVVDILYPMMPDPKPTKTQFLASVKARYKELI